MEAPRSRLHFGGFTAQQRTDPMPWPSLQCSLLFPHLPAAWFRRWRHGFSERRAVRRRAPTEEQVCLPARSGFLPQQGIHVHFLACSGFQDPPGTCLLKNSICLARARGFQDAYNRPGNAWRYSTTSCSREKSWLLAHTFLVRVRDGQGSLHPNDERAMAPTGPKDACASSHDCIRGQRLCWCQHWCAQICSCELARGQH